MAMELEETWVEALLRETYFGPCSTHASARKNERNVFCAHCQVAVCQHCLPAHQSHLLFQIRRYVYNDVIRLDDIQQLVDCEHVQAYIVNSAKVVFLNQRPQSRPAKGVGNSCGTCDRILQEGFRYCSLACRVEVALKEGKSGKGLLLRASKGSDHLSPNCVLTDATSSSFSPSSSVSTANDTALVVPRSASGRAHASSKLSSTILATAQSIKSFPKAHLMTWNVRESNHAASSSQSSKSLKCRNFPVTLKWARTLRWPTSPKSAKKLPFTPYNKSYVSSKLTSGQIAHINKLSYLEQSFSGYLDAKPFSGSARLEYSEAGPLPKRRKGIPHRSPIC